MADNFLYILGAGASCEAVPLVKDFPDRLAEFAQELEAVPPTKNSRPVAVYSGSPKFPLFDHEELNPVEKLIAGEGRQKFVEALRWLAKEAGHHASVDTLAKKFFLRGDQPSLKKLKAVLSAFLVVVQARKPVDKRYDSFFASVLYRDGRRELQIPPNIRILTWNYDTQLEKAFYGFVENNDEVYAKISNNDRIQRINGYCGKTPDGHWGPDFNSVWESPDDSTAMRHGIGLFLDYLAEHNTPEADIRFAWETFTKTPLERYVLPNLKESTITVIIGYSFPYFNRDIDKKIFDALPNLKRVYLQYPEGIHATIKERVEAMQRLVQYPKEIKYVTVDNQFYIPDEYSGPA